MSPCLRVCSSKHRVDDRLAVVARQPLEQFHRLKQHVRRPVGPSMSKLHQHLAVAGPVDPVVRHRRQRVPADPLEARPIARNVST